MGRWRRALQGRKADEAARARIIELRDSDPRAWAYFSCREDADSCPECVEAAQTLKHVQLRDPRLVVLLRGHPNCTSPEGCRCSIVAVAGHEPGPASQSD